ncbi:MAG: hypothetical protein QF903_15455 [Planctomycetota bacterium]|jgi:hypothetical protein|nr:hypothetical protein [Planctomycetota bacterium]MDP6990865.1 hypothetical protein [Planctomycetota bacterium]
MSVRPSSSPLPARLAAPLSALASALALATPASGDFTGLTSEIVSQDRDINGRDTSTVRLYAQMNHPADEVYAVYGSSPSSGPTHLLFSTTDPLGFYQHAAGGDTADAILPALFPTFPDLPYDSFVGLGADSADTGLPLMDVGIDWTPWNNGGDLTTDNGAWFVVPPDAPQTNPDAYGRVFLGQFTVTTGETLSGVLNIQYERGQDDTDHQVTNLVFNIVVKGALGTIFCFGDGGGTACPCGNQNDGSTFDGHAGCANGTSPGGAAMRGSGTESIGAGDAILEGSALEPGQPGLYFQGDNALGGGAGVPFGDGLRCIGGGVVRLEVAFATPTGYSRTSVDVAAEGGAVAGETKVYQLWYRNPSVSPCGSGFNLTNGFSITWAP